VVLQKESNCRDSGDLKGQSGNKRSKDRLEGMQQWGVAPRNVCKCMLQWLTLFLFAVNIDEPTDWLKVPV